METSFQEFLTGTRTSVSIFLKLSNKKFVKIIHKNDEVVNDIIEKYKAKGIKSIFIHKKEYQDSLDLSIKATQAIEKKTGLSDERKTTFLVHVSETLQEKLYKDAFNQNDFENAQQFVSSSLEITKSNKSFVNLVSYLKNNENKLYAHSLAVSIYSTMLGKQLDWTTQKTKDNLAIGGFLHDIGKKKISIELQKRNYLDLSDVQKSEWENHVIFGIEVLSGVESISKEVLQIIMQHHEFIDGTGYPLGLSNVNIFPLAKIVALIDRFSLLVMPLDNSPSVNPKKAVELINKEYKNKFDRQMLLALSEMIN